MEGISFVRESHLVIAEGCYLPRADLLGHIDHFLHHIVFIHPELKQYIPKLLEVDVFVSWDEDKFLLFISSDKRAHLPARGMETTNPILREPNCEFFRNHNAPLDISERDMVKQSFLQMQFTAGFAAAGIFPAGAYTEEATATKQIVGEKIAELIKNWAQARRQAVENSSIFLSHKGINKPLIEKVDRTLRLLSLKTWFDRDDLVAGDTLVRGVDNAFASCAAAVFFISSEFVDAGVIRKEIDRAQHEAAMRSDGFRIIMLVLSQHGGSDEKVPASLKTLVWKTVDDIEIVPHILRALPPHMQGLIRYNPAA
ncbi:TIR domain-containing protein [Chitinimonas arctica]|uniref:TIR domain-containing protein n=1 Tax=Chitinimonas arctica TaxID=2594795 RepID=A0A516SGC9_9NEIS|nr:toll/interleukin-1 receptor domain-containing protein [Chitinimonas arctica]QDQ27213.1 TIR domain-containing protein [Chitinimonas arctica]